MRHGTFLALAALTFWSCAGASTTIAGLALIGPGGTQLPSGTVYRPGDRVTLELDLSLHAVEATRVTEYHVTLESPQRYEGRPIVILSEVVPMEPPTDVIPGQRAAIRYTLVVSPAMAELQGEYILAVEVSELGVRATTRFLVRE